MKKARLQKLVSMIAALALLISLTACGAGTEKEKPASSETKAAESTQEAKAEETQAPIDPLAKYDPMIEVTTMRDIADGITFVDGQTIDDNFWTREEQAATGIKVKNIWVVPISQYAQKLNIAIASGDLPDFFKVNGAQLKNLVEADLIEEMGGVLEKYSAEITTKSIAEDPYAIKSCTFDGKVMAMPIPGSPAMDNYSGIWVRTDWLQALNLPEPKTMDDVLMIADAFKKNDPDGNKKNDTYGLGLVKDLWGGFAGLDGFFAGYNVYPNLWVKDASGNAVWGGIQPEIKPVLAKLQELYKSGQIDKEFGVKDIGKVSESISNNQLGLFYGIWWNPYYPLQDAVTKNPKMVWKNLLPVTEDGKTALTPGKFATTGYYVVKKGAKYPEVPVKLANYILDKFYVKNEVVSKPEYKGMRVYNYAALWIEPPTKNVAIQQRIRSAMETGDNSKLTPDDINNYDLQKKYTEKGDVKCFAHHATFGKESSLQNMHVILTQNLVQQTLYNFAPTKTMVEKQTALDKLQLEAFTKIIMGKSLDEFDKFVDEWKKAGGDEMTNEVNEWYVKNK